MSFVNSVQTKKVYSASFSISHLDHYAAFYTARAQAV